ncbi:CDGSH iron-sulfur domain-containing protein 1-like isoform X2 [Dinothrombium tinctorium]|uniref:CDGSH iron-sulfur domain-containing protein 1-like isoform X2 n=1 Tax=Dinothrombium tinctorium TaxID=1965070 RepID=A0A443QUA1_9ACAR|nr:CDGSH iron-sulfur domain-containing protein 1-like isoform X2 [Dinothrombium tinctorium]
METVKSIGTSYYFPWVTTAISVSCAIYLILKQKAARDSDNDRVINPDIDKDNPKVVHSFDAEDLFPYCDGAHKPHNKATGDNLGPLNINKRNNK